MLLGINYEFTNFWMPNFLLDIAVTVECSVPGHQAIRACFSIVAADALLQNQSQDWLHCYPVAAS